MKLNLENGKRSLILFSILFLALFFVDDANAQTGLGCCLISTPDEEGSVEYCSVIDRAYLSGICDPSDFDDTFDAVEQSNDVFECAVNAGTGANLCGRGCSVKDGIGEDNVLKIEHLENGGTESNFYLNSRCLERFTEEVSCIINGECRRGVTRDKCENILNGRVDDSIITETQCRQYNIDNGKIGCCLDDCRTGPRNDCESDNFERNYCANVGRCQTNSNCRFDEIKCTGDKRNIIFEDNICGGSRISECGESSYCCLGEVGCPVNGCKPISDCNFNGQTKTAGSRWCDVPEEPEDPGQVHLIRSCTFDGRVIVEERCGSYRDEICVEGSSGPSCETNKWRECYSKGASDCTSGDLINYCGLVGDECLPKHPPGFKFWGRVDDGTFDSLMCSVETSILGCQLSGDCTAVNLPETPIVGEEVVIPEPTNLPEGVVEVDEDEWAIGTNKLGVGPNPTDYWVNIFFDVPKNRGKVTIQVREDSTNTLQATPINDQPFNLGKYRLRYGLGVHSSGNYKIRYIFSERQERVLGFNDLNMGEREVRLVK